MNPEVSFIILSYRDCDLVIKAVRSIKKLKTKYKFDIFIVDNSSGDGTPKILRKEFRDVKVIELSKNVGTAGYNHALKKSKSKYIFFTGCDIEVKEDMLDYLVNFLNINTDVALAAPKYIDLKNRKKVDMAGTWLSRSFYSGKFHDDTLGLNPVEIPYIGTGLIRRDSIKKFGYIFDNDYFFYGEDVDLGMRMRLQGYKIYYVPKAIVYHAGSISRKIHKASHLTFLMERNLLRTFFQSLSKKNIFLFFPYVFLMRIIVIVRDILKIEFANAFARVRALLWVLLHFDLIIKKRSIIQKIRKVDDKVLLKYFSEKYLFTS